MGLDIFDVGPWLAQQLLKRPQQDGPEAQGSQNGFKISFLNWRVSFSPIDFIDSLISFIRPSIYPYRHSFMYSSVPWSIRSFHFISFHFICFVHFPRLRFSWMLPFGRCSRSRGWRAWECLNVRGWGCREWDEANHCWLWLCQLCPFSQSLISELSKICFETAVVGLLIRAFRKRYWSTAVVIWWFDSWFLWKLQQCWLVKKPDPSSGPLVDDRSGWGWIHAELWRLPGSWR